MQYEGECPHAYDSFLLKVDQNDINRILVQRDEWETF